VSPSLRLELAGEPLLRLTTDCSELVALVRAAYGQAAVEADEADDAELVVTSHAAPDSDLVRLGEAARRAGRAETLQASSPLPRFRRPFRALAVSEDVYAVRFEGTGSVVVCEERGGRRRVRVHAPCSGRRAVVDAFAHDDSFRVVRNLVYTGLFERGFSCLHAAAVDDERGGALVVGDRRAGKTFTSLTLFERGSALLANGTSFVRADDSAVSLVTLPERVFLRRGHLAAFDGLRRRYVPGVRDSEVGGWEAPEELKVPVFIREFDRGGRPREPRVELRRVVFPCLDRGLLEVPPELDEAERRAILTRNVQNWSYRDDGWFRPPRLREVEWPARPIVERLSSLPTEVAWLNRAGTVCFESLAV
jgi:hypothetical protein